MSRKPRRVRDPEMFDVEAGRRMSVLFDRARVEFGLTTDAELWRRLGVGRDTAQAWMRGERPPSRDLGAKVAQGLGIRYDDLLAVYEGRAPEEMDTATVIAALEWAIRLIRSGPSNPGKRLPISVHVVGARDSDSAGVPALSGRQ